MAHPQAFSICSPFFRRPCRFLASTACATRLRRGHSAAFPVPGSLGFAPTSFGDPASAPVPFGPCPSLRTSSGCSSTPIGTSQDTGFFRTTGCSGARISVMGVTARHADAGAVACVASSAPFEAEPTARARPTNCASSPKAPQCWMILL